MIVGQRVSGKEKASRKSNRSVLYWLIISMSLLIIIGLVIGLWKGIDWIVDQVRPEVTGEIITDNQIIPEIRAGIGEAINAEIILEELESQNFEIRGVIDRIDPSSGKEFNFFEAIGKAAAISVSERIVILANKDGTEFSEFYIPEGIPVIATALGQTTIIGQTTFHDAVAADLGDIKLGNRIQISVCYSPYRTLPQIQLVGILR